MIFSDDPHAERLRAQLVERFGVIRAQVAEAETAEHFLQRMQDAGMLYQVPRAALKDLRQVQALRNAEARGLVCDVVAPTSPEALHFGRPKTLDEYRTAKAAGAAAGKDVVFA